MSQTTQPVDIQAMDLSGYSLIEASAGTGKTFTLSHLYLRLIISPEANISEAPLTVKQILVVTFTNAATVELKTRIRKILQQALAVCEDLNDSESLLFAIVENAIANQGQEQVQQRLRQALLAMDEAAIFTIHGFCQKVLNEYRFFTNSAGELQLLQEQGDLLNEVIADIWRKYFYSINPDQADVLLSLAKSPMALASAISSSLTDDLPEVEQPFSQVDDFKKLVNKAETAWVEQQDAIKAKFDEKGLGRSYTTKNLPGLFSQLDEFCQSAQAYRFLKNSKLDALRQSVVVEKTAAAKNSIAFSLFDVLDELFECQEKIDEQLLAFCRYQCQHALEAQKADLGLLSFDDLINRLQQLLSGDNDTARKLCDALRVDYPVALIDEFQDTDSKQLAIFTQIYNNQPGQGLLFIGDPKQAIYSFRGGDIHSYFYAKSQVAESKRYSLATNYRSLGQLIDNINTLFTLNPSAFVANDFGDFVKVQSCNDDLSQGLQLNGKPYSFSKLSLDKSLDKSALLQNQAAEKTAEFIAGLLQGDAILKHQKVQPKQIAVLVRSNKQARLMQKKLSQKGLNSIFLSRDSVLASEQFMQMQIILQAVMQALDSKAVSSALALGCMGFNGNELSLLQADAAQFFKQQEKFIKAQGLWLSQGFMPMWQYLNQAFAMPLHLLGQSMGERKLSNFNQIAEVFQKKCAIFKQPAQQLQHFLTLQEASDSDEQSMRLESENNLIEIVTMHRSKGLEYDVVCCPFLFVAPNADRSSFVRVYQEGQAGFSYLPKHKASKEVLEQAKQDAFAEEVRILYVALTRAKYHINICFDYVKGADKSALWHVLLGQQNTIKTVDYPIFNAAFANFTGFLENPVINSISGAPEDLGFKLHPPLQFSRNLQFHYVARSYSALVRNLHSAAPQESGLEQEAFIETVVKEDSIFSFYKGARAGNFMHDVFEFASFQANPDELQEKVLWALEKYQFPTEPWQRILTMHFHQCFQSRLSENGLALHQLAPKQLKKEMAFQLYANKTSGDKIAHILSRYRGGSSAFSLQDISGLFIGFIDLLFEYQGKYYVLDYKSNYLGDVVADYLPEALQQSIEEHNYDLQYLIYLAALQRYLKTRLADYSYQQHIGGVYYLYLRGIGHGDTQAGIHFALPEKHIIDAIEALFQQGEYTL